MGRCHLFLRRHDTLSHETTRGLFPRTLYTSVSASLCLLLIGTVCKHGTAKARASSEPRSPAATPTSSKHCFCIKIGSLSVRT